MRSNKKAITPVVATVLIIMITISAIAILAGFIVPFVRDSLNKGAECIDYKGHYVFDESFSLNCYQLSSTPNEVIYAISVRTGSDKNLVNNSDEFRIVFVGKDSMTTPVTVKTGGIANHSAGGIWVIGSSQNLRVPGAGGIASYAYNGTNKEIFESAEVYAVLKSGRICEDKDSIKLVKCEKSIV